MGRKVTIMFDIFPIKPSKDVKKRRRKKNPNKFFKREFESDNTNFKSLPHGTNQEKNLDVVVVLVWSPHIYSSNPKPSNAKEMGFQGYRKCVRIGQLLDG